MVANEMVCTSGFFRRDDLFNVVNCDGELFEIASVVSSSTVRLAPMTRWEQIRHRVGAFFESLFPKFLEVKREKVE